VVDPAQLADDRRQGGPHDGLVQRGEQHAGHEAGHQQQDLLVTELGAGMIDGCAH
jgi:hypothetical protein